MVLDLDVIDDPSTAAATLDPMRARILAALSEPGSATSVAATRDLPRQKVNYHLRTLEQRGLVTLVEERRRRGCTERIVQASARSYVIDPDVVGDLRPRLARTARLSSRYLIALAARMVSEVSDLTRRADDADQTLATLAIDADIRFASAADRASFTADLTEAVHRLVGAYHDESAPTGRWHRLVIGAHPQPPTAEPTAEPTAKEPTP